MISAAPLYSSVHNWTSADCVRMCGIEDRRTALSDEESKTNNSQHLGSEDRVNSVLSKVDFIPATNQSDALMLQEDGGGEVETVQKLEEKPPDPILLVSAVEAVTPETRINISLLGSKQVNSMLDTSTHGASVTDNKRTESARAPAPDKVAGAEASFQPADADQSVKQKTVLGPGLQIAGQPVEASHTVVSSSFSTLTPFAMSRICFSTTQVPNVQKLPLSFPPGAVLTPSQPLVYIPPQNCGQSLNVTTLPTTFGVTSTLTLPILQHCLQERCLPSIIAPSEMHSHAFASSVGRPITTDPKGVSTELNKPASTTASTSRTNSSSITAPAGVANICSDAPSAALTTLQTLSSHPTLPLVSVNPVTLASYTRTSSNLESQIDTANSSISPLKSPPQLEREMVSPQDSCEMPLDLSSKSHRNKYTTPNQRKTPPMPVLTPVHTSGKASLSTVLSRSDSNSQRPLLNNFTSSSNVSQNLRAAPSIVMFPEFLRNGDPGSSQLLTAPGSWIKNSAPLISTIPGTYVGVANPVPASMLLNKDSSMSLSTDSRLLAKQEPISIIDQGEPKNSGSCSKKSNPTTADGQQPAVQRYVHGHVTSVSSFCPPKNWTSSGHGSVHPKCPLNGKPSNAQVLPVSWSPYHQASLFSIGISTTGTLHSSQGTQHRLPIGEYTLFPSILPAEPSVTPQKAVGETVDAPQKNSVASVPEQELSAKGRTCESLSKPRKTNANKALLAPKPAAGNPVLYIHSFVPERTDSGVDSVKGANVSTIVNKPSDKQNCKEEKIRSKFPCNRKSFGDSKPKNNVLATYMTHDQPSVNQQKESHCLSLLDQNCTKNVSKAEVSQNPPVPSKRSHKKGHSMDTQHCVQEVDLSKVKIERVDDDESFGCISSYNNQVWSPADMPIIPKVKTRIKKEPGLRSRSKRSEEVTPTKQAQQKSRCKRKQKDEVVNTSPEPYKRKWRRQIKTPPAVPEKKAKANKKSGSEKEAAGIRTRRRRRKNIKCEPFDPEFDRDIPERKHKNSFRDFIPVVLKSRTRSQTGNTCPLDSVSACAESFSAEEAEVEVPCKKRKLRNVYKACQYRKNMVPKEEPESVPISPVLRGSWDMSSRSFDTTKLWAKLEEEDDGNEDGPLRRRKRRRQKNRKYQNGEYLTEKEEEEVSLCYRRRKTRPDLKKRRLSPLERVNSTQKSKLSLSTRDKEKQGDSRASPNESPNSQMQDKPPGKRKCKTKHIGGSVDEDTKVKARRISQSPKTTPIKSPPSRKSTDPGTPYRSRRTSSLGSSDTPSAQHIPPEARRLIVNKNAGETLLQRAARLGYKDVVLYCLQRDLGDINHRDNAGYTALHEACARGWTDILQILLDNGANVNCSAQDGTRPIHDAVVNDNLETVWLLLSYGADPTLATYSGQTPIKLASSEVMRTYLSDYLFDLRGRSEGDSRATWDFYSSTVLGGKDDIGHDVILDHSDNSEEEGDKDQEDNFMFEFSDKPLLSCYSLHVSLTSGPRNWFIFSEVLKRLKLSSRIFQARYPHFEIASIHKNEFTRQVFTSQLLTPSEGTDLWPQDIGEVIELVQYDPELLRLLGSSVEFQCVNS
ncbi:BCL-6 corepressor 1 isoform X1 [Pelobates cultripes]|uniref:BCL-6 corepressor 1 isoform X1 n=1 Tax=Pelobates cultripes TaxID=61616 RepID=A0AAD1WMN8_PELCU|nr:BCL-6 corepressor 1 isoform X1 [Pelobates cultripes]